MQTRSENLDHHQTGAFRERRYSTPEAELIALARSKGQVLAERTLQLIRETLELRGVTLAEFAADVRPHFRNNIVNPSGFLINRARHFHQLSQPATVPTSPTPNQAPSTIQCCATCKGEQYVIENKEIQPCPACSTPEFRREWETKEAERARKRRAAEGA